MYIRDIVKDFYEILSKKQVLLIVHYDIDAVCTSKILQWLFRSEGIQYKLVPVQGISDLISAVDNELGDMEYIVLVNCGGTIDLTSIIDPDKNVTVFVIDSHRPTDLHNIYSVSQIRILGYPGDEEDIPAYDDVFESEESAEEEELDVNESDEDGAERRPDKMKAAEEALLKRRNKRIERENKARIIFEYSQFTYYGRCSASVMFELLMKVSKWSVETLWAAIVGVTSYLILGNATQDAYLEQTEDLKNYLDEITKHKNSIENSLQNGELSATQGELSSVDVNSTCIKIVPDMDINLPLYRQWTVEASLRHSIFPAVRLKLWMKKGEQRLQQLLVQMGLPLVQSRQMFNAMEMNYRHEFYEMMSKSAESHNENNFVFSSFIVQHDCRSKFLASEYVYTIWGLLNSCWNGRSQYSCFLESLDCLNRHTKELLDNGMDVAKNILTSLFSQVKCCMDMKLVSHARTFLHVTIPERAVESQYLSNPLCLVMLSRLLLRAYMEQNSRRSRKLPIIVSASYEKDKRICVVVGVPPLTEFTHRNFFGKAFEQAAKQINCRIEMDYFDTSVIRLRAEDRSKFLDSLTTLLA